jgi:hypothetical protein
MTEQSRFWNGTTIGDAVQSPYDADTEFAGVLKALAYTNSLANQGGVFNGVGSSLLAVGVASPVVVGTGEAIVYGTWYKSDAGVSIAVPTPSSATRIDRLVLRKSWAAQTVRLLLIAGAEGGSEPALVQTPGVTWDIPIASISITTGGVITATDQRELLISGKDAYNLAATKSQFHIINPMAPNGLALVSLTGSPTTMSLPAGVPPSAIAVAISVRIDAFGIASGDIVLGNAADVLAGYGSMLIGYDTANAYLGEDTGICKVNPGTPCTISIGPNWNGMTVEGYVTGWFD